MSTGLYTQQSNSNGADFDRPGALLAVFVGEHAASPPWVQALSSAAAPALTYAEHGVQVRAGMSPATGAPFVIIESALKADISTFEQRWLVSKRMRQLRKVFVYQSVNIVVPGKGAPLHYAMAEDCWAMHTKPWESEEQHRERAHLFLTEPGPIAADLGSRSQAWQGYRHWINENADELTSIVLADRLQSFAREHGCASQVLGLNELAREGMNLLLAVGQGSTRSPSRLIVLRNQAAQIPGARPLVLVGKGITFDTGGVNLKPHESFVNCMKNDMGGAALMAQLFMASVRMNVSKPLALVIPACENVIDAQAMKPGVVLRSRNGKHVLVEHTDAEGRLILADALSWTEDHLQPSRIWIAATLTTAAMRQFSNYFTAVHFADPATEQALRQAGEAWGEVFTFWNSFLPFATGNHTGAADLTNMGRLSADATGSAGSNVAAHFLREFVRSPMTHFDIFASGWNWTRDYPGADSGATGAPFNSLLATLSLG